MYSACVCAYSVDSMYLHVCVGTLIFKDISQIAGSQCQIVSLLKETIPE